MGENLSEEQCNKLKEEIEQYGPEYFVPMTQEKMLSLLSTITALRADLDAAQESLDNALIYKHQFDRAANDLLKMTQERDAAQGLCKAKDEALDQIVRVFCGEHKDGPLGKGVDMQRIARRALSLTPEGYAEHQDKREKDAFWEGYESGYDTAAEAWDNSQTKKQQETRHDGH